MSVWDDPDMMMVDDFVKFDEPGDSVVGEITGVRKHVWDDGNVCPQLFIRDDEGNERSLTAGQVQLKRRLAELRPNVGDRIKIVFTDIEKRTGGKTMKRFDVQVRRAGTFDAPAPAPEPAAAPTPAPADDDLF